MLVKETLEDPSVVIQKFSRNRCNIMHVIIALLSNLVIQMKHVVDGNGIANVDLQLSVILNQCLNHIYDFYLRKMD